MLGRGFAVDSKVASDQASRASGNNSFFMSEPNFALDSYIDSFDVSCNSYCDGQLIATAFDGTLPYTYDWTTSNGTGPFPNNDTIENLSYGWYYLTVTDDLGCTFSDSAFADSAYILVDYTVNVPCNAIDNGAININTNNVLLSEVTLLLIDTITLPNTTSTIVSYVSTYSGGGLLIQDPNIDTIMTFNGLASTLGNEVYELRVELFGNPQGAAGCDPVSYYIEIGDSVSMDASLDVLNSDLNLTEEELGYRSRTLKRVVASRNIRVGEILTENDFRLTRPAEQSGGYIPQELLGKVLKVNVKDGDPINKEMLS